MFTTVMSPILHALELGGGRVIAQALKVIVQGMWILFAVTRGYELFSKSAILFYFIILVYKYRHGAFKVLNKIVICLHGF